MRNRTLMRVVVLAASLQLGACGGGGGGGGGATSERGSTSQNGMILGVEYEVESGYRLISTSTEPAVIEVYHDLGTDTRYVTLIEGSAELF